MLSWQAMLLNGFFRLTMKRHGKKPLDLERLRAMGKNPPRSALAVPAGYSVESLRNEQGLEFDVADVSPSLIRSSPQSSCCTCMAAAICSVRRRRIGRYSSRWRRHSKLPRTDSIIAWRPSTHSQPPWRTPPRAYQWLLNRHPGADIVLAGDSAGAGLAIATAVGVRDAGFKLAESHRRILALFGPGGHRRIGGGKCKELRHVHAPRHSRGCGDVPCRRRCP